MKIYLYRHAPTQGNLVRQYLGSTDQPLCPEGIALAKSIAGQPCPTAAKVYTSTLCRTAQTANILFPDVATVPVQQLCEMDFGRFEGKTYDELKDNPDYRAWLESGQSTSCPGGEKRDAFVARCVTAFRDILSREMAAGSSEVFMVLHGGTLMAVLSELALPEKPYFEWHVPHCGGMLLKTTTSRERPLEWLKKL